jgi:aminopeptidase
VLLAALDKAVGDTQQLNIQQAQPPMTPEEAYEYSNHLLAYGTGLRPGDHLVIEAQADSAELAAVSACAAYRAGASKVTIITDDVEGYRGLASSIGLPADIRAADDSSAWMNAVSDDATFMTINDRPEDRGARAAYWDAMDQNKIRWSLAYWPTPGLARSVYGDDPDAEAKLGQDLREFTRCSNNDEPGAMKKHLERLHKRSQLINNLNLTQIIIENGEGDRQASFGLLKNSRFGPCHWQTESGKPFGCNIPTEEIFCTPDPKQTQGNFRSVRPTRIMGLDILSIEGEFVNGELQREGLRLVTADPSLDPDTARDEIYNYLRSNPGMLRVGELALIGEDSRIGQKKRVYGIANIDENVGCHFALGDSYLAGLTDFVDDPERNRANGHIDITFAEEGTQIYGVTEDGRKVHLMANGQWRGPLA